MFSKGFSAMMMNGPNMILYDSLRFIMISYDFI